MFWPHQSAEAESLDAVQIEIHHAALVAGIMEQFHGTPGWKADPPGLLYERVRAVMRLRQQYRTGRWAGRMDRR